MVAGIEVSLQVICSCILHLCVEHVRGCHCGQALHSKGIMSATRDMQLRRLLQPPEHEFWGLKGAE